MWVRRADEADVPLGIATGAMLAIRSSILAIQPFVLALLLNAGESNATVLLGAICMLCAIVFYAGTRSYQKAS